MEEMKWKYKHEHGPFRPAYMLGLMQLVPFFSVSSDALGCLCLCSGTDHPCHNLVSSLGQKAKSSKTLHVHYPGKQVAGTM